MKTGAMSLVQTAARAGVEVCFTNPGTTELPLVRALDEVPGVRAVLGLFEGVCTGAADGWARMTGRPAATLLHLGPGLANGIANLHNARRARTPVVNWIGDHAGSHLRFNAPLTSDIAALAGAVGWTRKVRSPLEMSEASLAAIDAALGPPGHVASLIIPADCQWEPGPEPLPSRKAAALCEPPPQAVHDAAALLRLSRCGVLLGGNALSVRGLRAAARVAAAAGCGVWIETFAARQERGRHVPAFPSLPYFPEKACAALVGLPSLVLAGAREPVAFFGYPGQPSRLAPPDATLHFLADPDGCVDAAAALEALADELGAPTVPVPAQTLEPFAASGRPLDAALLGHAVAAFTPEDAVVVSEAGTTGFAWQATHSGNAAPHTVIGHTGGAIGQGLPNALGAAIACPGRRVIAFQSDGAGLYTVQALWSMAREGVDVTVVVAANRRYRILQEELRRAGVEQPGPKAQSVTELARPTVDWVSLSQGFGVPARRVATDVELAEALAGALRERGPRLVEAVIP